MDTEITPTADSCHISFELMSHKRNLMDLVTVIFFKICCPKDVWNISDIAEHRLDIQLFGDLFEQSPTAR